MAFPVERCYVEETERQLGVKFPASFVAKMLHDNGGEVATPADAWQLRPFLDKSDRKRFARTSDDIVRETAAARKWRGFPPDAIAIGNNGCGDRLVLVPTPGDPNCLSPEVYWWDHETGEIHNVGDLFARAP